MHRVRLSADLQYRSGDETERYETEASEHGEESLLVAGISPVRRCLYKPKAETPIIRSSLKKLN